jgi:hypothetical protein
VKHSLLTHTATPLALTHSNKGNCMQLYHLRPRVHAINPNYLAVGGKPADMHSQSSLQECLTILMRLLHAAANPSQAQVQPSTAFMPQQLTEVTEPAAQAMAARMQRTPVPIPSLPIPPLATAFVGPSETQKQQLRAIAQDRPPVVLLHGFDSSSLEFRRLYPLLEPHTETYAVDLVRPGV